MKLTYEQYRMLASLGPSNDRIILKNKKGRIIPNNKWENEHLKETRFTSMAVQPRQSSAVSVSPLHPFHYRSSPALPPRQGKR